jgi:hypothetical protein
MQRKHTDLQHEPVISIKVFDLLVAGLAVLIVIVGFRYLLEFSGLLLALVLIGASGYVGFRIWSYHQEHAQIHAAKLERFRRETRLIEPEGGTGNYPVYFDPESNTLVRIQPGNIIQPVPQTYAPHFDYRLQNAKAEPLALPEPPAVSSQLALPGLITLKEVVQQHPLDVDHVLLGFGRGGQAITCDLEGMMHIAHDGPTGSGKTGQWMAEMAMLLHIGVQVVLVNPNFRPIGKGGEDWKPIGRALERQELPGGIPSLCYTFEMARDFLAWLSQEVDRRYRLAQQERYGEYLPLYGFLDEWAAIVSKYPACADSLADVIRRGRAVDVYVSTNSQGFLTGDVNLSSADRENFNTAYFLGGSVVSGAALLNLAQRDVTKLITELGQEGITLGKGVALLRNTAKCEPAQVVRLPYADNASIYYLFGKANEWKLPEFRTVNATVSTGPLIQETQPPLLETVSPAYESEGAAFGSVSVPEVPASVREAAQAVSGETRQIMRRLVEGSNFTWREIAQKVGLAGEKYGIFREVCRQMGYETSTPRRKQGGR